MDTALGINIENGAHYKVIMGKTLFLIELLKRFLQADQFEILADVPREKEFSII